MSTVKRPNPVVSVVVLRSRSRFEILLGNRSLGEIVDELYLPEDYMDYQAQPWSEAERIAREQAGIEVGELFCKITGSANGIEPSRSLHAPRLGIQVVASEFSVAGEGWCWVDPLHLPENTSSVTRELLGSFLLQLVNERFSH